MDAWPAYMQLISLHVGAILTFCIFSFLYKDNPFYKFAEYLVVGVSAGYYTVIFWNNYIKTNLYDHFVDPNYLLERKFILLIPTILGFMLLTRFSKKYGWLSRYSFAVYLGSGAGLAIPRYMDTIILKNVTSTMIVPFTFTNIVIIIGVLCTLIYFFFSKPHKGVLGGAARIGIIFIMISFGATFGYTVMGRVSLLIGRVFFLLKEWLPALQAMF